MDGSEFVMNNAAFLTYTTMAGDTFDILALDFYNDEFLAKKLIDANPTHAATLVFKAGVLLQVPLIEEPLSQTLPPWQR